MTVISEHYFIKYGAYNSSSAMRLDPGRIAAQKGIDKLEKKLETMPAEIEAIKQYVDAHALR